MIKNRHKSFFLSTPFGKMLGLPGTSKRKKANVISFVTPKPVG